MTTAQDPLSHTAPIGDEAFRLLVESIKDYAIFMLDLQGNIVSWSAGAEQLKGYRAQEIIGQHFSRFYPPEDQAQRKPERELDVARAEGRLEDEGWRVRKDGSRFWANVVITALYDSDGELQGFAKITRDLTERRRAEKSLRDRNAQLEAEQRHTEAALRERNAQLEAALAEVRQLNESLEHRVEERTAALQEINAELEAFSYSISHDLRAPLRAMQGFAEALQEDYGRQLEGSGRLYTERIVRSAERMDQMIQELLAYSRLSRAQLPLQPVSLEASVNDALRLVEHEIAQRGARVEVARPLPVVIGHRATLVQVLANLISNALKFVPPGQTPSVRIGAEQGRGRARLWVEDNGLGIAPEHQDQIFRVFERLHGAETYPGTGIGLAVVRKGMERMGGEVGVKSAPGQGSCFWLELPMEEPA